MALLSLYICPGSLPARQKSCGLAGVRGTPRQACKPTYPVWSGSQELIEAVDEVVEVLLVIAHAVGVHRGPHAAEVVAQSQAGSGPPTPARLHEGI